MPVKVYSEIDPSTPEWLITGLVPLAGYSFIIGDGGNLKSYIAADWAARITRGRPMPGDDEQEALPVGSVILVSTEDDPDLSMSWRLMAAGADMTRVYDMTDDFEIPGSLVELRAEIAKINDPRSECNQGRAVAPVRMVVIDPISDVSSIPLGSGVQKIRRQISRPLKVTCRETGIAGLIIGHTTKNGQMQGSAALSQAARMVLRVRPSALNPDIRVMEVEKTNIGAKGKRLGYMLVGNDYRDLRIEYVAGDNLAEPPEDLSTHDKALAILAHAAGVAAGYAPHASACPDCAAGRALGSGPLEPAELARRLGIEYNAARTLLSRAKRAGEVCQARRGLWTVPNAPAASQNDGPVLGLPGTMDGPAEDDAGLSDPLADHCTACLADDHDACGQAPTGAACVCQHGRARVRRPAPLVPLVG